MLPVYISQVRVYISILTFFSESQSLSHNSAFIFHHKILNKKDNCFLLLFFFFIIIIIFVIRNLLTFPVRVTS